MEPKSETKPSTVSLRRPGQRDRVQQEQEFQKSQMQVEIHETTEQEESNENQTQIFKDLDPLGTEQEPEKSTVPNSPTELSFFKSETHSGDSIIVGLGDGAQNGGYSGFSTQEPSPFQTLFTDMQKKRLEETGFKKLRTSVELSWQRFIDSCAPHLYLRWIFSVLALGSYVFRVYLTGGWYVISYALSIYILNLFIGFLTPQSDLDVDGPSLPTKMDDEFRPFIRRLPEFKFWYSTTRAVCLSIFCTLFPGLDIPVYWPILVGYFLILFTLTMRHQIKNMIKYQYLPWSSGKKTYSTSLPSGKAK